MAQLSNPNPRKYELGAQFQDYPVIASGTIYEGSAVSDNVVSSANTGNAEQLVATENFLGFARSTVINTGAAGAVTVNLFTEGYVVLSITGATVASTGVEVYASDGNTFTTTSTSNTKIGRIVKFYTGTTCLVHFQGIGYTSI